MNAVGDPTSRTLITPEGVDLRVRIATASERAGALLIDLSIITAVLVALTFVAFGVAAAAGARDLGGQAAAIVWLLGAFILRNFYFTSFECGPRAATPGKRIMKLRVASRDGGPLRVEQVITRNALRELELYLPMSFLLTEGREVGALIILCGVLWCAIFVFFPLFNRDRWRLGDIVAGAWVLKAPRQVLAPDVAEMSGPSGSAYAFSEAELSKYGIAELHVLERVLRAAEAEAVRTVAETIRGKLGRRKGAGETDLDFLRAYYAALRKQLERKMLFGVRKRDKHDAA
jgi:uncharacterized RDD family membrane protein YckC